MPNWILLTVLGIVAIIAGVLALLNPFPASLAAVRLASWAFLILGAVQIFEAFRAESWGGKLWTLLIGVVAVLVGINLLGRPLAGLVTLTLVLGVMFVVSGIFKFIVGWRIYKSEFKVAVLISGAASLIVGFMVMSSFPASAAISLGILLGIELISNGISASALGLSRRRVGSSTKHSVKTVCLSRITLHSEGSPPVRLLLAGRFFVRPAPLLRCPAHAPRFHRQLHSW